MPSDSIAEPDGDLPEAGDGHHEWGNVPSVFGGSQGTFRGRDARAHISKASTVASAGADIVSHAHLLTAVGVAGAAALTAGTAGIALPVIAGAFTVASGVTSGVSAYKTGKHLDSLDQIFARGAQSYACECLGNCQSASTDHLYIGQTVLPYIIAKKEAKLSKKMAGAVGLAVPVTAHRIVKAIHKMRLGTKGKHRSRHADALARHTVTCECQLARAIVTELFSESEYLSIRSMGSADAGLRIATKMKSI